MSVKRPAEEEIVPPLRNTRIILPSPSPERTSDSDTESIHHCQEYGTEPVAETIDPDIPSTPSPPPVLAEYELEDEEEEDEKLNFFLSDESEVEILQKELLIEVPKEGEGLDKGILGDTSEENSTSPTSNSDVDPELPRNDYLDFKKCLMCQTKKKDSSYQYCDPCFRMRKYFFPSRPKRTLKDFKRKSCKIYGLNDVNDGSSDNSCEGSKETTPSEDNDNGPSQTSHASQPSTSYSNSTSNSANTGYPDLCRVCFSRPENGLFVHLHAAHRFGCYKCAKKIWCLNRGCPICRKKVYKITQLHT